MKVGTVSALWTFPIKSAGGFQSEKVALEARGFRYDRRWMLVDESGKFLTQRTLPQMTQLQVQIEGSKLVLNAPERPTCVVSMELSNPTLRQVTVWRSECEAWSMGEDVAQWLQEFLGISCSLVWMPESTKRSVNPEFHAGEGIVSFADGYPCLATTTASLEELQRQSGDASLELLRFRSNLVISNTIPFDEDTWVRVRVGSIPFAVVKPCERCSIPNLDPQTGLAGKEPLRTLSSFRKRDGKVFFGQNLIPLTTGSIQVGDEVFLEERGPANPSFEPSLSAPSA